MDFNFFDDRELSIALSLTGIEPKKAPEIQAPFLSLYSLRIQLVGITRVWLRGCQGARSGNRGQVKYCASQSGNQITRPSSTLLVACGKQGTGQISRIGIPNSQRRLGIKRINPYFSATCTQRPINQESKFDLSLDRSVTQPPGHFAHRLDSGRKARNRYLTCPLIPISLSDLSLLYLSGANGRLRRQTKTSSQKALGSNLKNQEIDIAVRVEESRCQLSVSGVSSKGQHSSREEQHLDFIRGTAAANAHRVR